MLLEHALSLNDKLKIYRFSKGVKLHKQEGIQPVISSQSDNLLPSVASILALPFSFYFLNTNGETVIINEEGARICGFTSADCAVGKSLFHVSHEASARHLINNCQDVIDNNSVKIFEEKNTRKDGQDFNFLSIKSPWYDDNNHIIGVFGCSIVLGKHGLAESLSAIVKLGLFDADKLPISRKSPSPNFQINNAYLSNREIECLKLTIKGYTAKRIGQELNISYRTVEEYLNNIRIKTGTSSKAELIELTVNSLISID